MDDKAVDAAGEAGIRAACDGLHQLGYTTVDAEVVRAAVTAYEAAQWRPIRTAPVQTPILISSGARWDDVILATDCDDYDLEPYMVRRPVPPPPGSFRAKG
jgi:hypothetical protein